MAHGMIHHFQGDQRVKRLILPMGGHPQVREEGLRNFVFRTQVGRYPPQLVVPSLSMQPFGLGQFDQQRDGVGPPGNFDSQQAQGVRTQSNGLGISVFVQQ